MRQALWNGPLEDPQAPQAALLADMPDYPEALERMRALVRHGLPADAALAEGLRRWPWSVDLAWLVAESGGGVGPLQAVVQAQGRRHGTLAWALWFDGQDGAARAALRTLDPASPSHAADRVARAELAILSDLPAELPDGPEGVRLDWLQTWRSGGGAALARRFDQGAPAALAGWLVETFVTERDLARAHRALALATGEEHALLSARLAIEAGDAARARAALAALPPREPWDWSARRHVLDLRAGLLEAAEGRADPVALRSRAAAALRLFARHGGLRGVHLECRLRLDDWDAVIADLQAEGRDPGALTRLGRPDLALALFDALPPAPPDERFRQSLQRAEALLRSGNPDAAWQALPPPPAARPLAADLAWWQAEIALARRDLEGAGALYPALAHSPTRMGLHLSAARLAFFRADTATAQAHLATFATLKTAQTGTPPPPDLRDRIVSDDQRALAARAFALARPAFSPGADTLPRRIAHYWEGPRSAPVERGLRAWAAHLPQTLFDAQSARAWLATHAPGLTALFDRQRLPATRADLFRVALMAQAGGVFADLDEYPRTGIDDWLTGARAVLVIEEGHGTLANNFLAAIPGLPLFVRLQTRIAGALSATDDPYPWWDSGPAQLTVEALGETDGIRYLSQAEYDARVSTNLPFPHKAGPLHWR